MGFKQKQKFKVLEIIRTGGNFGDHMETDMVIELNGRKLYCESHYFIAGIVYNEKELRSYEGKWAFGYLEFMSVNFKKEKTEIPLQIKTIQGRSRYSLVGKIKNIKDTMVLADFGIPLYVSAPQKELDSLKEGDFISLEGWFIIRDMYFGELPHISSISNLLENQGSLSKNLNRVEWANNCTVLKTKKRETQGEIEVLLKCEKTQKPFCLSVKTSKQVLENQKVKAVISTNKQRVPLKVYEYDLNRQEYYTQTEETYDWSYINSAIGKVQRVIQDAIEYNATKCNIVVIDAGQLLIESIDTNKKKAKTGDWCKVGLSHYCSALFDAETDERQDG